MTENELNLITARIIYCAFIVSNNLGCGFLEKVYENAMVIELKKQGLEVKQQQAIKVHYGNSCIGDYMADLLVENEVVVELKTIKNIDKIHHAQLLNYLKATGNKVGLILNFSKPRVEIKRMVNQL